MEIYGLGKCYKTVPQFYNPEAELPDRDATCAPLLYQPYKLEYLSSYLPVYSAISLLNSPVGGTNHTRYIT